MRDFPWIELIALLSGSAAVVIFLYDRWRNGRNDTDHQDPRGGW